MINIFFLWNRRYGLLSVLLLLSSMATVCFAQYTVSTLPHPKERGQQYYVSNPDGILSTWAENELNQISQQIDSTAQAEFAIVVVNNFQGDDIFTFALQIFNTWGIGKKGSDNGLLLFIAKDRREYRFISGYGMEGIFPDIYLKRIGEKYLVPNFRNEDYDMGVLEASRFIAQVLQSPDTLVELESMMPEALPFWNWRNPISGNTLAIIGVFFLLYLYVHFVTAKLLKNKRKKIALWTPVFWGMGCMALLLFVTLFIFAFVFNNLEDIYQRKNLPYFAFVLFAIILAMKITNGRSTIIKSFQDEEDLQHTLKQYAAYLFIPILLSPLAWIDLIGIFNRFRKNAGRFNPPDQSGDWERVNRSDKAAKPKSYLNSAQLKEETVKSLQYEIWKNTKTGEVKLIPWNKSSRFKECPRCHYYTLEVNKTKTITAATYSSSGKGEKYDSCQNCDFFGSKGYFTIPRKSERSGGRSSSGGGGSSSSSGSGSFGGGSSGGGGAGGKW